MSVDVFKTYGPAGKLIKRPGGACPDWCTVDHDACPDDGVHTNDHLSVDLSTPQAVQGFHQEGEDAAVVVSVQQNPGESPFVMVTHHDGHIDSEDPLTPSEARKIACALEKNASIIRACGNNTCWCDGAHGPGDWHMGERESVPLSLTSRPYTPNVCVYIARDWDAPAAHVQLDSHSERAWDMLTPDEAERLAAALRRSAALVACHQAARQLAEAGR